MGETRRNRRDATREPRQADDDSTREPRRYRGRQRGGRDSDSDDEVATEAPDAATAEPEVLLRRALREGRPQDVTREPLADCETREPRQADDDSTKEPRRSRHDATREPLADGETRERRRRKGGKRDEETAETGAPTEGFLVRRNLGKGRNGRGRIEASISNNQLEFGGLVGEVVFGEVDVESESVPLTITLEETTFQCNVEVRRGNRISCRALSEDDFKVGVTCAIKL